MLSKTRPASVLAVTAMNWFRPSFLLAVSRGIMDYHFANAAPAVKRVRVHDLGTNADVRLILSPHNEWSVDDLAALTSLVLLCKPRKIFEFGTCQGFSTVHMIRNAPPDAHVFTLDLLPEERRNFDGDKWDKDVDDNKIGTEFKGTALAPQITQLLCDSRTLDTSPYARKMDFIFIDACHDYPFVLNDTKKALEMAAPGGIIAWHDYSRGFPGVRRVVEDLAKTHDVSWIVGSQIPFCRIPS